MNDGNPRGIVMAIQIWFLANQRPLPWREPYDPYRVWVSEVMLQQTQVSKVIPYFQRFMERFPTLEDLARSDEQTVLLLWSGLGYYSRARNLLKGARFVLEELSGQIPSAPAALRKIPGIGRYAAGAISSIAFEEKTPVVDGNVKRVLARIFGIEENVSKGPGLKRIWELAEKLVSLSEPRYFNQGMMELGATVCLPRNPSCDDCPARRLCMAYAEDLQDYLPITQKSPPTVDKEEIFLIIRERDKALIARRKPGIPYEGMWEFPRIEVEASESTEEALERINFRLMISHGSLTYRITHYRVTARFVNVFGTFSPEAFDQYDDSKWVGSSELGDYPLPAPVRRFLEKHGVLPRRFLF